jgi:hypothetical protein
MRTDFQQLTTFFQKLEDHFQILSQSKVVRVSVERAYRKHKSISILNLELGNGLVIKNKDVQGELVLCVKESDYNTFRKNLDHQDFFNLWCDQLLFFNDMKKEYFNLPMGSTIASTFLEKVENSFEVPCVWDGYKPPCMEMGYYYSYLKNEFFNLKTPKLKSLVFSLNGVVENQDDNHTRFRTWSEVSKKPLEGSDWASNMDASDWAKYILGGES